MLSLISLSLHMALYLWQIYVIYYLLAQTTHLLSRQPKWNTQQIAQIADLCVCVCAFWTAKTYDQSHMWNNWLIYHSLEREGNLGFHWRGAGVLQSLPSDSCNKSHKRRGVRYLASPQRSSPPWKRLFSSLWKSVRGKKRDSFDEPKDRRNITVCPAV